MKLNHIAPAQVRFWAWVDSGIILVLAIPPLAGSFLHWLYRVNGWVGGPDTPPDFLPIHLFFVCLSGALVGVWVIARLLNPTGLMALIDGWGRAWVAGLILYFVIVRHAPVILLAFVITEGAGALIQLSLVYRRST